MMSSGISLQCRPPQKPMLDIEDSCPSTTPSPTTACHSPLNEVENVRTEGICKAQDAVEDPLEVKEAEAPAEPLERYNSFYSWTEPQAGDPSRAPNRLSHEDFGEAMMSFMKKVDQRGEAFEKYIRKKRCRSGLSEPSKLQVFKEFLKGL
eukprot:Skav208336  [mRNA]  locus=scaffold1961:340963:344929:+ [translate_table: standard]